MARMTLFPRALGLVMGIHAGLFGAVALAQEGGLILPENPGGNFAMTQLIGGGSADMLQVFFGPMAACCDGRSPLAGRYSQAGDIVTFDPAFDLNAGQVYTIRTADVLSEFTLTTEAPALAPEVIAIYPSGPEIPENTLRFYIHFSTPMQPHVSTDFIQLLDADGIPDTAAFMTFTQELWSEDRTRLTLLMDPGRIKRGVATNLALGPALLEGHRYSITVTEGWLGANGQNAAPEFEQSFLVSAPLRDLPDTDLWQISEPSAQTREPLIIAFDRPFDHQLAQTSILVRDTGGQVIPGTVELEDFERTWQFIPDDLWPLVPLEIVANARLEDVAGNNFRDLLDHAVETDVRAIDQIILPLSLRP